VKYQLDQGLDEVPPDGTRSAGSIDKALVEKVKVLQIERKLWLTAGEKDRAMSVHEDAKDAMRQLQVGSCCALVPADARCVLTPAGSPASDGPRHQDAGTRMH
jgi:hypothetical protein